MLAASWRGQSEATLLKVVTLTRELATNKWLRHQIIPPETTLGNKQKEYTMQRTALEEGRVKAWYQRHQEDKHDKQTRTE